METLESTTCTPLPIVTALDRADEMIGPNRVWHAVNGEQKVFLPIFDNIRARGRNLKEIKSIASKDVNAINRFLKDEGFDIQLEPFKREGAFGTASVLDVLVEWLEIGQITRIVSGRDQKTTYPGVILGKGVSFARSPLHTEPIAMIETKSGDVVGITVHDRLEGLDLSARANALSNDWKHDYEFDGVHFPQVDLNQEVNIEWLIGAWTKGDDDLDYEVDQALQQTKFRMNEKGARAESAVAIAIERCCTSVRIPRPPLVINKPFLVWIEREGLDQPLFTGWISEANWKTPKDISVK